MVRRDVRAVTKKAIADIVQEMKETVAIGAATREEAHGPQGAEVIGQLTLLEKRNQERMEKLHLSMATHHKTYLEAVKQPRVPPTDGETSATPGTAQSNEQWRFPTRRRRWNGAAA